MYERGRRQDGAGVRRDGGGGGGGGVLSHTRKVRDGREGGMKQGEEERKPERRGTVKRKTGSLAQVQGYHWQKPRHLPAASWRQKHSARRMLPCAACVGWCVRLCLCICVHSMNAAEQRALSMC